MKNTKEKGGEKKPENPGRSEGEKAFDEIVSEVPCGIYQTARDDPGRIAYANAYYYGLFGYSEDEAKEKGFDSLQFIVHPPDFQKTKKKSCSTYQRATTRLILKPVMSINRAS